MFARALRLLLALTFVAAIKLHAQIDTGRILGLVTDQSGAVVSGAKVTLSNTETGLRQTSTTGTTGYYVFPALKAGNYEIEIEATGFSRFVQSSIALHVQQDVVVGATLVPGAITERVEVKGTPALLQTENASLGQTIGTNLVNDLPLNGRNWTQLVQLDAGVTYSQPDSSGRPYFSANGHPLEQNDYRLNGINNNDEAWTLPQPYVALPPPDAIQEFRVETSNYSAEFGHSGGAVIDAVTKSGTNQLHGAGWEFLRNSDFDAAQFFENAGGLPKGAFHRNQFGASVGGPVVLPHVYNGKDKTFFFVDYQGTRIRQAQTSVDSVPTTTMHDSGYTNLQELITDQNGTRTDALGRTFPLGTVFDPATTRAVTAGSKDPLTGLTATQSGYIRDPFYSGSMAGVANFLAPGIESRLNLLPTNRLDPNGIKLLGLYPTPNQPGLFNNFVYSAPISDNTNQVDFRIDHNFSARDQVFLVGSWSRRSLLTPGLFPGVGGDGQQFQAGERDDGADAYALSETHSFSPTLVNEARLGYSRSPVSILGSQGSVLGIPSQFGIQGVPQVAGNGGLPAISISGLTAIGTSGWVPTKASSVTWDLTENLTKIYKSHTFKGGFQGDYIRTPCLQPAYSHGVFDFNGTYTEVPNTSGGGTGMAQVLLTPTASSVPGGFADVGGADEVLASNFVGDTYTREYYGAYFQDDWKLSRKLTLNLGLRWDHTTPYKEAFGAMSNFLPGPPGNGAAFLIPKNRCQTPLSSSFTELTQKDGIAVSCTNNEALGIVQNFNFAPRIGFAYQLFSKLVARAGYGIFYGALGSLGYGNTLGNSYPFLFNFSYYSPDPAHPIAFPNGSIGTMETGLSGIDFSPAQVNAQFLSLTGRQYNYQTPYYEDYNFSLQYQFSANQTAQVAYVGNQGHHMNQYVGENSPSVLLPPGLNPQNYVPFPDFGRGSPYEMTGANTFYNALQLSYEHRFNGGLAVLANYSYSQCRSDWISAVFASTGGFRAPLLPGFGIRGDYGLCAADVRNLFHFSGMWTLPFGHGHRFLNHSSKVVNELLGGWQMNWILNVESGMPFTIGCPIATTADFGCDALLVPGQNVYGGAQNVNQWLNPAAFANPAVATSVGQSDYSPLGGAPTQARGPGQRRLDFSLFKIFPVTENTKFEFRAEAFNLTNTPWFANPSYLDFTNKALFGKITSLIDGANDPREIELALKFYW